MCIFTPGKAANVSDTREDYETAGERNWPRKPHGKSYVYQVAKSWLAACLVYLAHQLVSVFAS